VNRSALGRLIVWAAVLATSVGLGCSPAAAVKCPDDNPTCPSPAPSYQADVGPLIAKYCSRCHAADGGATILLQSFEDVTSTHDHQISHVLTRIKACIMPPADQPQPTAVERTTILSWFACCETNGGTCAR
jgi:uncharacterized membrane protein